MTENPKSHEPFPHLSEEEWRREFPHLSGEWQRDLEASTKAQAKRALRRQWLKRIGIAIIGVPIVAFIWFAYPESRWVIAITMGVMVAYLILKEERAALVNDIRRAVVEDLEARLNRIEEALDRANTRLNDAKLRDRGRGWGDEP
jgi:hypothetical protein